MKFCVQKTLCADENNNIAIVVWCDNCKVQRKEIKRFFGQRKEKLIKKQRAKDEAEKEVERTKN